MENKCGIPDVKGGENFKDGKIVHYVKYHTQSPSRINLYDMRKNKMY